MKPLKYPILLDNVHSYSNNINRNAKGNNKSTAIWWIAKPVQARKQAKGRKQSLSATFCDSLAELLRNISLHGYSKLLSPEFNFWEKLIWVVVQATTLFALLTVLTLAWEQFVAQYVQINLHDPLYPVENVPFPAVAICSNNRISLQVANGYATWLNGKDPNKRSVDFFKDRIEYFNSMYFKLDARYDYDRLTNFQAFLDIFGIWENETYFNTRRVVTRITPKCQDLIFKCYLGGTEIACFGEKAFQNSLTVYGACCTFNLKNVYKKRDFKDRFVSVGLGLTVVLNTTREDDFAPILNSDGYIVIVHGPDKYPDLSSGASREVFPPRGQETFVSVRARIIDTEPALRSLSPISRKCYFNDEAPNHEFIIQNTYSFANCITYCRIKSILALCECVPFYMPLDLVNRTDGVIYCTLQHVQCLTRYNYKWRNVLTERKYVPGLERAMEDALYCPNCLPSCEDVQYEVSVMSLPLDRYQANVERDNRELQKESSNRTLDLANVSLLNVHFDEPHAQYYRRMAGNSWFEAFSTVGNICSIFSGFSLVIIFEVSYVLVKNLLRVFKRIVEEHRPPVNNNQNEKKLYILP